MPQDEPEAIIQPHDGLLGDPAVPVRQRPAFGLTPMSGYLFSIAAGLLALATGVGIIAASSLAHAVLFWAAILVGHFAVSYFMWVDPLPASRFVAVPLGIVGLWGFFALSFLVLYVAPAWVGWTLCVAGLLGIAVGVVPLSAAWWEPRRDVLTHRRAQV
jgi:hypothetical protein